MGGWGWKDLGWWKGGGDDMIIVLTHHPKIGQAVATRGEIKQVKVLGVIAMIDEGQ